MQFQVVSVLLALICGVLASPAGEAVNLNQVETTNAAGKWKTPTAAEASPVPGTPLSAAQLDGLLSGLTGSTSTGILGNLLSSVVTFVQSLLTLLLGTSNPSGAETTTVLTILMTLLQTLLGGKSTTGTETTTTTTPTSTSSDGLVQIINTLIDKCSSPPYCQSQYC